MLRISNSWDAGRSGRFFRRTRAQCSNLEQISATIDQVGAESTKADFDRFGPNSTNFDQKLHGLDQHLPDFGQLRPGFGQNSASIGPELRSNFDRFGPNSVRHWPNSTNSGAELANFGRDRPTLARSQPNLGHLRSGAIVISDRLLDNVVYLGQIDLDLNRTKRRDLDSSKDSYDERDGEAVSRGDLAQMRFLARPLGFALPSQ